jgi:hypothetical protein
MELEDRFQSLLKWVIMQGGEISGSFAAPAFSDTKTRCGKMTMKKWQRMSERGFIFAEIKTRGLTFMFQ